MCSISGLFHDEVESCLHYLYRWQHESMQHTNIFMYNTCVYLDTAYSVWQMSRILLPYFALITNFVHKTTTPCIIVYYKSYIFFEWIVYVFTTFSFGSNHQENCACFFLCKSCKYKTWPDTKGNCVEIRSYKCKKIMLLLCRHKINLFLYIL